jgi:hypothetical protein
MPEKFVIVLATGFSFSYAILNRDIALITNYGPLLVLDTVALAMRLYYVYKNKSTDVEKVVPIEIVTQ